MIAANENLIGFEATALESPRRSGVGHYTEQLLEVMARQCGSWRFALLASRALPTPAPEGVIIPDCRRFPTRTLWMQLVLPRIVSSLRPRLCHFTNFIAPLSLSCPFVVTIYDMSHFLYPETQPRKSLWLVRTLIPAVAKRAKAIITISQSARNDILRVLKPRPETVHVVYPAPAERYREEIDDAQLEHVRTKYGLEVPFVLFVGTLEPRKNLPRLINAFASLRKRGRKEQLVLAGQPGWHYRGFLKQVERSEGRDLVRLLGYIPPEDLPAIYRLARGVALPSFYEGFGLPIIEAMSCGIPVLTSNRSSTAELGEGAAVLVDPYCEEEIENGLLRLLTDDSVREDLREAGLERAARFSWARAAKETCEIYHQAASRND